MKAQYGSKKKYHFLYKTTNLINGRFYYGMHSTDDLQDGYVGSGTYLKRSINKYGKDNFHLEHLVFFETREALVEAEKQLITTAQVSDLDCMNLKPGGNGGFVSEEHKLKWVNARSTTHKEFWQERGKKWRQGQIDRYYSDPAYREVKSRQLRDSALIRMEKGSFGFKGKKHKLETIEKMKLHKGKQSREKNSQFGTRWITNEIENKKIKATDQIPEGWRLGRRLKDQ